MINAVGLMCCGLGFVVIYLVVKVDRLERYAWRQPPIEHYTRASVVIGRIQVDAGLEHRDGDPPIVGHDLWQICQNIANLGASMPPMEALKSAEPTLLQNWPGRAWFLEIGDPEGTAYSQVYLPYGRPRWRYDDERMAA